MQVKNAVREGNKLKSAIQIDAELFRSGVQKAYEKQKKNIRIPGFRPGKVPRTMIEHMYGKDVFYEDGLNEIFPEVYQKMILDEGWKAVGQPSVTELNVNDDMTVDLTVETELYPEVKLGAYKGVEVEKAEASVTDEEVERELDKKVEEVARITTVDRAAKEGDTAVIDFEGFLDGVPFEGGKGEDFDLRLGSGQFIPGFEEQLIGAKAGDEVDVNVTFPEDYHEKTLAGKPTVFKVKVHEIKETVLPEKDDDLAKDVSEFDTLDELKEDLRKGLLKTREEEIERRFADAALEKALETVEMDVPACMIDDEVEQNMKEFDNQLRMQGMSLEQYSKMLGGDLSAMKQTFRPGAEKKLKVRIMLDAIAEAEKLEASEDEIEDEFKKLADDYQMDVESLRKYISAESLKGELEARKAQDLIVANAVIVAPKAEEAKEEKTEE